MKISLVVAASKNDVIGHEQSLPWDLPEDLRRFRDLTVGHPVILGRLTHESILARLHHPLAGRTSIVVSSRRGEDSDSGVRWASSIETAILMAKDLEADASADEIFIIGGASIYGQALPLIDKIYLTRVHQEIAGDSSLPPGWLRGFRLVFRDDRTSGTADCSYSFLEYVREPS